MLCAKQLVDSPDTMSLFLVPEIVSWSHSHSPDCSLACVHPFPLQTFGTDFGTATKTQTGRDRTSGPIHKQGRGRRLCGFGTGHYQTPEGVRRGKRESPRDHHPKRIPRCGPARLVAGTTAEEARLPRWNPVPSTSSCSGSRANERVELNLPTLTTS